MVKREDTSEERFARIMEVLPCYREPAVDEDGMAEEQIQRIKSLVDEYLQYRGTMAAQMSQAAAGVTLTPLSYEAVLKRADRLVLELSEFKFWRQLRRK